MKTLVRILLVIGTILTLFTVVLLLKSGQFIDVEPFEFSNPNKLTFYWSPITAIAFFVAGGAILIIRKREKRKAAHKY